MSIVLKENEWAENILQSKSLGRKPSETLRRVARYYIDDGYDKKKELRQKLEIFLLQCDPLVSLPKWDAALDYAINSAFKYEAVDIDSLPVTKSEIKIIRSLDGRQIERLAFTLLCLSKYWHTISPETDYWVNNKDNEIMALANINTSIRRQCLMFGILKDKGLIRFSKRIDNTNVRVCFADDTTPDAATVMHVSDFRNLGYQYMMYIHRNNRYNPYFECENCGITVKYNDPENGRKQKFCKTCASEIAVQQRVNYIMRRRKGIA